MVRRFHDLYYGKPDRTWNNTFWRGVGALKCPLDLWIYQEIIFETRPDVIVETGTAHGGGAWFMGDLCDLIGDGESVMVVLDSRHLRDHVVKESHLYGELVRKGHYLIVEDTNLNLNPRGHGHGPEPRPGPFEAVREFLADQDRFEIDRSQEKFFMTQNLSGYLRCIAD